jgi:two-component system sensor histidine kinase SenX3
VLAYLRLLQERAPVFERVEVDLAVQQALTLKHRLDDIMLLNQLEAGLWEMQCGTVSIQEVIACVVQDQRWRMEERGLALRTQIACACRVRADRELLSRALAHLFANACKFSKGPGAIELTAHDRGHVCSIAVRDQGIGIPADKQARIFDPFYQADLSRARRYNGMGIGLRLTRAIVEKHGGSIQVYSEVGQGSTFTVSIPLA